MRDGCRAGIVAAAFLLVGCASVLGLPDEYSPNDGTGGQDANDASAGHAGIDASAGTGGGENDASAGQSGGGTGGSAGSAGTAGSAGSGGNSGSGGTGGAPAGSILDIDAGLWAACAIVQSTLTSHVYCWGTCDNGLLAESCSPANQPVTEPQLIVTDGLHTPLDDVKALAMAERTTCALKNDGTVWCWGRCSDGAVGNSSCTGGNTTYPVQVRRSGGPLTDIQLLGGGGNTFCAADSNGQTYCWGLDLRNPTQHQNEATEGPAFVGITTIDVGSAHACVVAGGTAKCWGANNARQSSGTDQGGGNVAPMDVPLGGPVQKVAAGNEHTCALLEDTRIACWGAWSSNSSPATQPSVVQEGGKDLVGMVDVTALYWHSCALSAAGKAHCWGSRAGLWEGPPYGQLEDAESHVIVRANNSGMPLEGMSQVRGDGLFACAASSSEVFCWGNLSYNPLDYGCAPDGGPVSATCVPEATKIEGFPTN